MGIIYKITNKQNGRSYIGGTSLSFENRYQNRWWATTHNTELQDDAFKLGSDFFEVTFLFESENNDELGRIEQEMIEVHQTMTPNGYNKQKAITIFKPGESKEDRAKRIDKLKRNEKRRKFYEDISRTGMEPAETLKKVREFLNMDQQEFSVLQGVSLGVLRKIEQNDGNTTVGSLKKCLKNLGLKIVIVPTK
jgi:DNA-binding transcriptional regulator YiaG